MKYRLGSVLAVVVSGLALWSIRLTENGTEAAFAMILKSARLAARIPCVFKIHPVIPLSQGQASRPEKGRPSRLRETDGHTG